MDTVRSPSPMTPRPPVKPKSNSQRSTVCRRMNLAHKIPSTLQQPPPCLRDDRWSIQQRQPPLSAAVSLRI
uniref:Testis expressed 48 n=1 Tax=Equus caballus TaxID=9796 RepID=A0A9L0SJA2_HORSE